MSKKKNLYKILALKMISKYDVNARTLLLFSYFKIFKTVI